MSYVVFLYCSQNLATFIKYLLNVFDALSFQDYKNRNIQKTETLEPDMVVRGIPVHTRLEQEDCKFEASLKKIAVLFFRKYFVLIYMSHGFLLLCVQVPSGGQKRMWGSLGA